MSAPAPCWCRIRTCSVEVCGGIPRLFQAECRQAELMMKRTIRRILVAVEPSKPGDAAFDQALALARGSNAELYLLHTPPPRPVSRFSVSGEDLELQGSAAERSQLSALTRSAKN